MTAVIKPRADSAIAVADPLSEPRKVWVVVKTHSGKERLAKFHLQKQGFEIYLPMQLPRGRAGVRPFFPGYLFARITQDVGRWQAIFSTIGVHTVFTCRERLIGVKDAFLDAIRAQEVAGLLDAGVGVEVICPFEQGDEVLAGPLTGIFQERVDVRRAAILVSLLGVESVVTVDLSKLTAS